jgi:hypothetical protein
MRRGRALALMVAVAGTVLGPAPQVCAVTPPWMTAEAMRAAFIGKTLDGHYGNGVSWTEAYLAGGRLDYREAGRNAAGYWYFRDGNVFCTFYDPPDRPALAGGCWNTIRVSANCYEFYLAGSMAPGTPGEPDREDWLQRWNARAWRNDAPSTCHEKPSV